MYVCDLSSVYFSFTFDVLRIGSALPCSFNQERVVVESRWMDVYNGTEASEITPSAKLAVLLQPQDLC